MKDGVAGAIGAVVSTVLYLIWAQHVLTAYVLREPDKSWVNIAWASIATRRERARAARFEVWNRPGPGALEPEVPR